MKTGEDSFPRALSIACVDPHEVSGALFRPLTDAVGAEIATCVVDEGGSRRPQAHQMHPG
jgi:hypothetical protein